MFTTPTRHASPLTLCLVSCSQTFDTNHRPASRVTIYLGNNKVILGNYIYMYWIPSRQLHGSMTLSYIYINDKTGKSDLAGDSTVNDAVVYNF